MRQPILYAEVQWRRQRLWAVFLFGIGVVMTAYTFLNRSFAAGVGSTNRWIFVAYIPGGLLFAGVLLYYRWRSYVQITEDGLKVSNLLRSVVIDYGMIRSARVQPLERHFLDAGRKVPPIARELAKRPALFVRLKGDEGSLAEIRRKLGLQLTHQETVAVPVADPDAMSWELTSRIRPDRGGSNLGGQRRPRRPR